MVVAVAVMMLVMAVVAAVSVIMMLMPTLAFPIAAATAPTVIVTGCDACGALIKLFVLLLLFVLFLLNPCFLLLFLLQRRRGGHQCGINGCCGVVEAVQVKVDVNTADAGCPAVGMDRRHSGRRTTLIISRPSRNSSRRDFRVSRRHSRCVRRRRLT